MEEEILRSIDKKLATMIKLLASNSIEGKNKTQAIIILADLGIDTETIAKLVDTTPASVNARLWEHKKKVKRTPKKLKSQAVHK